jgi:hypothetical protein
VRGKDWFQNLGTTAAHFDWVHRLKSFLAS